MLLAELGDVQERIRYLYCNPAKANLVASIEEYPGVSSYRAFRAGAPGTLTTEIATSHPWITANAIPVVTKGVAEGDDYRLTRSLAAQATLRHDLVIEPNLWMDAFGISDEDVPTINRQIEAEIRKTEESFARSRTRLPKGRRALTTERPSIDGYRPEKKERRIWLICKNKTLRIALIEDFKRFSKECEICYRRLVDETLNLPWPPGAFKPPLRPAANSLNQ